jgi:hypothetical protein
MQKATKVIAMMVSLAACAAVLASCTPGDNAGENEGNNESTKVEWAKMNYPDYDKLYADEVAPEGTEGYWDYWETKTVTYQFINDKTGTENHGFANYFPFLLNLYEDGSIKAWERCIFIPSMFDKMEGATEEQNTYNTTYKLLELYYGYWEQSGTTVTIHVQNSVDYDVDGDSIVYTDYTFSTTPSDANTISFYINATEKGQAIKSLVTCDLNYVNTVRYTSYANFATSNLDGKTK